MVGSERQLVPGKECQRLRVAASPKSLMDTSHSAIVPTSHSALSSPPHSNLAIVSSPLPSLPSLPPIITNPNSSSMQHAQPSANIAIKTEKLASEDLKYQQKYKELKKKIKETEEENDDLTEKVYKAKRSIRRMKMERSILFDKLTSFGELNRSDVDEADSLLPTDYDTDAKYSDDGLSDDPLSKRKKLTKSSRAAPPSTATTAHLPTKLSQTFIGASLSPLSSTPAPKLPSNAFYLFCQSEKEAIKHLQPNISVADLSTELGLRWKALSDGEKKTFYNIVNRDLERYASKAHARIDAVLVPGSAEESGADHE